MYLIDLSGICDSKLLAVGKYDREVGKVGVATVDMKKFMEFLLSCRSLRVCRKIIPLSVS